MHSTNLFSKKNFILGSLGALSVSALLAGPAEAISFYYGHSVGSTNSTSTGATATVDLDFVDLASGDVKLTFSVENISEETSQSRLMGVGFDLTDGDLADLFGITGASDYEYSGNSFFNFVLFDDNSVNGQAKDPDGNTVLNFNETTFDLAIANKAGGIGGGGSPNSALGKGQSTTVTLTLKNASKTADELETALLAAVNEDKFLTGARFRGISGGPGGGSDKLAGCLRTSVELVCGGGDPNPTIPEPAAGLGLVTFGAVASRLKRQRLTSNA